MRRNPLAAIAVAAFAIVVAAGCGSSSSNSSSGSTSAGGAYGGGTSTKSTSAATGGGGGAAVVSATNNPKLGKILVNSKGITLYYFKKDKQGSGTSTCNGACASIWPPYTTSGSPTGQNGASASKLGTLKRSDGSEQVTYAGWPLYTYTADTKPGDTTGNDFTSFGAQWYAITPAGTEPTKGG